MKLFSKNETGSLRRMCALILLAAMLSTLLAGCYLLPEEEETLVAPELTVKEVTYSTYTVEKGDIERWENGTGYFVSTRNETLLFGKNGTMKKVYVRAGEEVEEGQLLAELDTNNITDQIEQQEYMTERARLNYLAQYEMSRTSYGTQIAKLDYDYQQRQLEKLYAQAENSLIYAPFDGIVTYAASLKAGDYVEADRAVVTVADPTQLIIQYKPTQVEDIYTGMSLSLTLTNDNKPYTGHVIQTPADAPLDATDEDKTNVYIELDQTPDFAKIGGSVLVNILLEKKEDVIALPSKYLSKVATRYYVRVLVDGLPEERDVSIGITNGSLYEITGGLEVGEQLVA